MSEADTLRIKLHSGQYKVWESDARYVAMIAGTGAGKSWFGPIWLYREIQRYPQDDFLVVSPTYTMFQRIVLPRMLEFMMSVAMIEYKATERALYLPTGGKIYFGSADNPLTLEGVHVRAAWIDEAGQMRREAWEVIQRRVGYHKGRILLTTTPYNLGWLKTELYDRWKAGDKNYDVIQFASIVNPAYPKEEFERAKATMPEWKFKMFYLGQFAKPEGMVYQDFNEQKQLIDAFEIPKSWRRVAGMDFGYNNPSAVVWTAISPDDEIYIYREYYERGKIIEELADEIIDRSRGEEIDAIYCDPSNPAAIEELRRKDLPAQAADNAVKQGIEAVIEAMRGNRLYIFKGLNNLLDELENYHWKENGDEPVKEYDHCLTGDTVVNTVDGDISIKDLVGKTGQVYCYDEINKKATQAKYDNVRLTQKQADVYEVELDDGRKIKATAEHLILTQNGWKQLKDLTESDAILDICNHL